MRCAPFVIKRAKKLNDPIQCVLSIPQRNNQRNAFAAVPGGNPFGRAFALIRAGLDAGALAASIHDDFAAATLQFGHSNLHLSDLGRKCLALLAQAFDLAALPPDRKPRY